jgi:hypothetical protein
MSRGTLPVLLGLGTLGRTLHLVDIENLAGNPDASPTEINEVLVAYRKLVPPSPQDHVVIASSRHIGLAVGLAWPGARLLWRDGPNGADLALIGDALPEYRSARYTGVIVGSGDGIFSGLVVALRRRGLATGVVSRRGSLSETLRGAAGFVKLLPESMIRLSPELELTAAGS